MKLLVAAAVSVVLVGCAVQQQPAPVAITEPTPVCTNDRQCEAMWASASHAIELTSRMRIRYQTDTEIDTFAPFGNVALHGHVTKRPLPEGGYAIEPRFDCRDVLCRLVPQATNLFNMTVTDAGAPFKTKSK